MTTNSLITLSILSVNPAQTQVTAAPKRLTCTALFEKLYASLLTLILLFTLRFWPQTVDVTPPGILQSADVTCTPAAVSIPNRILLGQMEQFNDATSAYLFFDYYRVQPAFAGKQLLLVADEITKQRVYRILEPLPNNLLEVFDTPTTNEGTLVNAPPDYNAVTAAAFNRNLQQSNEFLRAYNSPSTESLDQLPPKELRNRLTSFILFKSLTDPRLRQDDAAFTPPALTKEAASRLAADMIAVSKFYNVPLELLIGIGAMENNYLDIAGDLNNAIWQRRPLPDDLVLRKRRGRVLVLNSSFGIWQITRRSLRYAQKLYLDDKRDYYELPSRLIPPMYLDMDSVDPEVLTTYAALLLRDLLDKTNGDVPAAVGAYNGTLEHPNVRYAAGVQLVANYARRVLTATPPL